jgi:hypothetical protein
LGGQTAFILDGFNIIRRMRRDSMQKKRRFVTTRRDGLTKIAIITGIGRVLDLGAQMGTPKSHLNRLCGECRDAEALSGDWYEVGDDLRRALASQRGEKTKARTPEITR